MAKKEFKGLAISIIIFVLGLFMFFFPTLTDMYYSYAVVESKDKVYEPAESIKAYNKKLEETPHYTEDPFEDLSILRQGSTFPEDIGDSVIFAFISIEKINLRLPIYLGATREHLDKGAAVIRGTSIPIGGKNTNSVIAAHTGRVKRLFTDLPTLEQGDMIEISNCWGRLYYKVTGNKIIWPDQAEYLNIVEGRDMLTLLTCYHETPENDRFIVFAQRYYPEQPDDIDNKHQEEAVDGGDQDTSITGKNIGSIDNDYSYLSTIELNLKPWHLRRGIYPVSAMALLTCLFLYKIFER
ncbi:MAG TPA: class C sortase [Bacillota bacterium]|nr:class C sortase [Bacillota bacterium]